MKKAIYTTTLVLSIVLLGVITSSLRLEVSIPTLNLTNDAKDMLSELTALLNTNSNHEQPVYTTPITTPARAPELSLSLSHYNETQALNTSSCFNDTSKSNITEVPSLPSLKEHISGTTTGGSVIPTYPYPHVSSPNEAEKAIEQARISFLKEMKKREEMSKETEEKLLKSLEALNKKLQEELERVRERK